MPVNMISPEGRAVSVPDDAVEQAIDAGFRPETAPEKYATAAKAHALAPYQGAFGKAAAGVTGLARGVTVGLSDVALRAAGLDTLDEIREANPGISMAGEIAGSFSPVGPAAAAARAGRGVATAATGAGGLAKIARAGAGAGVEGAILGAGQGVSELALSDEPLTAERIASVLSSRALYGGAVGAAAGTFAKAAEVGLSKARDSLISARNAAAARATGVSDDLATLDRKGLRAAEEAELGAIETARVTRRAELADEIAAFRAQAKDDKIWLLTYKADDASTRAIGKQSLMADRQLDRLLNNPKALAQRPQRALDALQAQEHALEQIAAKADDIKAKVLAKYGDDAAEQSARIAALEKVPGALERNRSIQAALAEVVAKPQSVRLAAIQDAADALAEQGGRKAGMVEQMATGTAFSTVAGAVAGAAGALGLGPLGAVVAPIAAAKASKFLGEKVFGRVGRATAESIDRAGKAVEAFLGVASKVAPYAGRTSTQVLRAVTFDPGADPDKREDLPKLFRRRSAEVRAQVSAGPDGPQMALPARQRLAGRLDGVRAVNPRLADQIETVAARRVEFLARKLPTRPDVSAIRAGGPDTWQPSDLAMRAWARYVDAVEDPIGVVERMSSGAVTPEDAEALREVYPEMLADLTQQIITKLPELRERLPYHRRLALSILTGVPVDPAMEPSILAALQQQFAAEDGSEGGTQAPRAQPQFGSVRAPDPTAAQQRAG